jgi:tetratricopeptide (TPR) repeat protein
LKQADNATSYAQCVQLYEDRGGWNDLEHLENMLAYARKLVSVFSASQVFFQRVHSNQLPGTLKKGVRKPKPTEDDSESNDEGFTLEAGHMGLDIVQWETVNLIYAESLAYLAKQQKDQSKVIPIQGETRADSHYLDEAYACERKAIQTIELYISSNIAKIDRFRRLRARLYLLALCFQNRDFDQLWAVSRHFIERYSRYADPFIFAALLTGTGHLAASSAANQKVSKYFTRIATKHPDSFTFMMTGHNMQIHRSFSHSVQRYFQCACASPNNPLAWLCLSVALLERAMQRRTENRHLQVVQSVAAMKRYEKLRNDAGEDWARQEALYNVGRAFMQLSLFHLAVPLFEQALDIKVVDPKLDLSREIAYALSIIYTDTGATKLARQILIKHCTI